MPKIKKQKINVIILFLFIIPSKKQKPWFAYADFILRSRSKKKNKKKIKKCCQKTCQK